MLPNLSNISALHTHSLSGERRRPSVVRALAGPSYRAAAASDTSATGVSTRRSNQDPQVTFVSSWDNLGIGGEIGSGSEGTVYKLGDDFVLKVFDPSSFYDEDGNNIYDEAMKNTAKLANLFSQVGTGPQLPSVFWFARQYYDDDYELDRNEYALAMKRYDKTAQDVLTEQRRYGGDVGGGVLQHMARSVRRLLKLQIEMNFVNTDCHPDNFFYDKQTDTYVIGDTSATFTCTVGSIPFNSSLQMCAINDKAVLLGACLSFFNSESAKRGLPQLFVNEAARYSPIRELLGVE